MVSLAIIKKRNVKALGPVEKSLYKKAFSIEGGQGNNERGKTSGRPSVEKKNHAQDRDHLRR